MYFILQINEFTIKYDLTTKAGIENYALYLLNFRTLVESTNPDFVEPLRVNTLQRLLLQLHREDGTKRSNYDYLTRTDKHTYCPVCQEYVSHFF